jgi:hypothetical protein
VLATGAMCGDGGGTAVKVVARVRFDQGAGPVALAVLADGRVLVGERLTGAVRIVEARRSRWRLLRQPLAVVEVGESRAGQRGLLGLAVIGERVFAAWTRPGDRRIVVGQVSPERRTVWEGPVSSRLANGGHLEVTADGRLLIGVGDLQEPALVADPTAPNGKLLALDPDGRPDQVPEVVGSGWNNPFAFTVTSDGAMWVADNSPGDAPERLGRGESASEAVDLPGKRAPAALTELGPGRLGLCGFLDGRLVGVDLGAARPRVGAVLFDDGCRTGAVRIDGQRLAVSDGEEVTIVELPE